jgi:hypothetical protein
VLPIISNQHFAFFQKQTIAHRRRQLVNLDDEEDEDEFGEGSEGENDGTQGRGETEGRGQEGASREDYSDDN